jgi:hypothetical protein
VQAINKRYRMKEIQMADKYIKIGITSLKMRTEIKNEWLFPT